MNRLMRLAVVVVILTACVGCDQTSKSLAREYLEDRGSTSFLADMVRLQYAENTGGFLSFGDALPRQWRAAIFVVGAGAVVAAALVYALLASSAGVVQILALSLICSGGVGNILDRVRYDGHVTDFLNIGIGPVRTGIFNVADVALMAGIALYAFQWRGIRRNPGPDLR
jgi:signal peptidase II